MLGASPFQALYSHPPSFSPYFWSSLTNSAFPYTTTVSSVEVENGEDVQGKCSRQAKTNPRRNSPYSTLTDLDAISMIVGPFVALAASVVASRAVLKYELENNIVTLESLGIKHPPEDQRSQHTLNTNLEPKSYFALLVSKRFGMRVGPSILTLTRLPFAPQPQHASCRGSTPS